MADPGQSQVSRPLLYVLGGVAVFALLFMFVINPLLLGGDEETDQDPVEAASPSGQQAAPQASPDAELQDPAVPEADFEIFSARDPFQQLVTASSGGSGAGGDGSGGGSGSDGTDTTGSDGGDPLASPAPSASPQQRDRGADTVSLVDVFDTDAGAREVLVSVNGSGYQVGEGDEFADDFVVESIADAEPCATFSGNSRFTLCEGEQLRK
jgi:hypothetical protein